MEKSMIVIIIQILLIFALILFITFFVRINNAYKLEKRIKKYTVKDNNNSNLLSFSDVVWKKYLSFVKKQRKKIKKLFPKLSLKYEKYVMTEDTLAIDFVIHKIVIALLFVFFTTISMVIRGKFITLFQLLFSLVLGFYVLDLVLIIIRKSNNKKIENDMLRAIIVMNNAFKSGKSTIQAVEIASNKLPKPIGLEFKKMHQEMKYGLSTDVVFDRFARRVNNQSAEYLSSSLIILNRTGGNIIAVFDSIEKTLFDKKKMEEELKNSTTVSKLVVKLLLCVPIFFVLIIYLLNPEYFNPFFNSTLGYILVFIIVIMFLIYAYLLDKIVKVDY